jgi:hypothetical protein
MNNKQKKQSGRQMRDMSPKVVEGIVQENTPWEVPLFTREAPLYATLNKVEGKLLSQKNGHEYYLPTVKGEGNVDIKTLMAAQDFTIVWRPKEHTMWHTHVLRSGSVMFNVRPQNGDLLSAAIIAHQSISWKHMVTAVKEEGPQGVNFIELGTKGPSDMMVVIASILRGRMKMQYMRTIYLTNDVCWAAVTNDTPFGAMLQMSLSPKFSKAKDWCASSKVQAVQPREGDVLKKQNLCTANYKELRLAGMYLASSGKELYKVTRGPKVKWWSIHPESFDGIKRTNPGAEFEKVVWPVKSAVFSGDNIKFIGFDNNNIDT